MNTVSFEQESNPWLAQAARLELAAQKLNLDAGLWKILRHPQRTVIVSIPTVMDDGSLELFTGFRVQHSIECNRGFSPDCHLRHETSNCGLQTPADALDN